MADITVTAISVAQSTNAQTSDGTAGATITAGQSLYLDATDSKLKAADANGSAATAEVVGIALHPSVTGQPLKYQTAGNINLGATLVAGEIYVQSANAGGIAPVADLVATHRTTILGVAISTSILTMKLYNSGIVHA